MNANWISQGGADKEITESQAKEFIKKFIDNLGFSPRKVLLIPPDFTRYHSDAGKLCSIIYNMLSSKADVSLLPALGTHRPMTKAETDKMFPGIPENRIHVHDWQNGLVTLGEIAKERLAELSEGKLDFSVKVEVDQLIVNGGFDLILSVGQVVPHEVVGMANGNKNILVGCAGPDTINKSHYLGAVCNMERIMGRAETPVRDFLNEAEDKFLNNLPIYYLLTVRSKNEENELVTRGLFAGKSRECYMAAARLSEQVNIIKVPPLKKTVVYLDPEEFKSTWLGNKAVYRTRMAIADEGELLIIAPGLVEFGEAEINEKMIRKYGYRGTPATLEAVAADPDLRQSLGAAAHLIHGSSEGRFKITYAPGKLSRAEIESVGFEYAEINEVLSKYPPNKLQDGFNTMPDGEQIYFISNPALGLWRSDEVSGI